MTSTFKNSVLHLTLPSEIKAVSFSMIKNSPGMVHHPCFDQNQASSVGFSQYEREAGKSTFWWKETSWVLGWGKGCAFLKHTYKNHLMIQSSLERRKKQNSMKKKGKLAETKMNPQSRCPSARYSLGQQTHTLATWVLLSARSALTLGQVWCWGLYHRPLKSCLTPTAFLCYRMMW